MTTDIKEFNPQEVERLKRNLRETSMNEGSVDLACRCADSLIYIEQLEGQLSAAMSGWRQNVEELKTQLSAQTAVKTEQPSLSDALDIYEAQTEALPLGYDIPERGESAYNWQTAAIRDIRALLAQRPDSDKDPMDWPLPCDVNVGHGTFKKGVKLRTLVIRLKVLYEMATGKDSGKDAERYRWLRDHHPQSDVCGTDDREEFDAVVDRAIANGAPK